MLGTEQRFVGIPTYATLVLFDLLHMLLYFHTLYGRRQVGMHGIYTDPRRYAWLMIYSQAYACAQVFIWRVSIFLLQP